MAKNEALLLIDIQNDFIPGGALAVAEGDQIVPIASKVANTFPLVVASQDWHPKNHGSFASVASHPVYTPFKLNGREQIAWPNHCVQGSKGAEFPDSLDTSNIAAIFRKGMDCMVDSYSAFFDNGHENDTGLAGYLRGLKVGRLFVMGLATDYCVKFTVLDALDEGFEVFVIADGCRGVNVNEDDSSKAFAEMKEAGATVVTSSMLFSIRDV